LEGEREREYRKKTAWKFQQLDHENPPKLKDIADCKNPSDAQDDMKIDPYQCTS
jgi:hypothetical protein